MRKLFKLVGEITLDGMEAVNKGLSSIDKEARNAEKTIGKFGQSMAKAGENMTKFVTGPIVALGAGMVMLAGKTGQYADKIKDLQEITGLSGDSLQEMEHIARIAGVSFEGLTNTVSQFTRRLPEIAKGTGYGSEAIKKLGVNIFDANGNVKDMNVLWPELVRALQGVENITERNAMSMQIFGRSINDLAPVLGMSADELESVRAEAHDLGLVMSEEGLEAADKYRQEMERLKAQFTVLFRELSIKFMPLLKDEIFPLIQTSIIPAFQKLIEVVSGVAKWFSDLPAPVKQTTIQLIAVMAAVGPLLLGLGNMIVLTKGLTAALLRLNLAALANPFVLAATAIGLVAAAIIATDNAWTDWNKNIGKNVAEKQARAVKESIEELIPLYHELALMDRQVVGEERFAEVSARIKELETNLGDAAIAFEGSFNRRAMDAENYLTDLAFAGEEASASVVDFAEKVKGLTDAEKEAAKERAAAAKKLADEKASYEQEWTDKLNAQIDSREVALEREYEQAIERAELLGADKADIEAFYELQRVELERERVDADIVKAEKELKAHEKLMEDKKNANQKYLDDAREKAEQFKQGIINAYNFISNQVSSIFSGMTANNIANIDRQTKQKIEALDRAILGEEAYAAQVAEIEADADKQKLALQRKQAQREKVGAIFNIIVSTAQAIMKSFSQLGPIAGAVAAALMAALGAVQLGVVASKPLPFAEGALVQGGRGGVVGQIGEGREDELVFPLKTGIQQLADALIEKLSNMAFPEMPQMAMAGGGANYHFHIGTLIADDNGIKEFERRARKIRIAEDQRRGI